MGPAEITPVKNSKELREFLALPYLLYREDPYWVQPLWTMQKQLFESRDHPFYGHGEIQCFLTRRDGHPVGRIAAILDHDFDRVHKESAGFFGFFESINDPEVSRALLEAARNWVSGRGARFIRGPMNPSANYECGLLIEGFASTPQIMMTYNPQYYAELIEGVGFRRAKDLYSFYLSADDLVVERAERIARHALETDGVRIRPIEMKNFESEVQRVW